MRYVVVGAGAIGGTVAGLLAMAGHETLAVARGDHARAIREHGLRVTTPEADRVCALPIVETVSELRLREGDALVLAVKSQDTAALLPALASLPVGDRTAGAAVPLFCFQNSIRNEPESARFFQRVHGVALSLPASQLAPGRVEAYGWPMSGILEIGRFPHGTDDDDLTIAHDLTRSGFVADARDDVMSWKRTKLLLNLANALEPLCSRHEDQADALAEVSAAARAEGTAVFAAAGMPTVPDRRRAERFDGRMQRRPIAGSPRRGGSTWQSIAKGASSVETGYLNGEISLLGQLSGIRTPVNDVITRRMCELVAGRLEAGSVDPRDLLERTA